MSGIIDDAVIVIDSGDFQLCHVILQLAYEKSLCERVSPILKLSRILVSSNVFFVICILFTKKSHFHWLMQISRGLLVFY